MITVMTTRVSGYAWTMSDSAPLAISEKEEDDES